MKVIPTVTGAVATLALAAGIAFSVNSPGANVSDVITPAVSASPHYTQSAPPAPSVSAKSLITAQGTDNTYVVKKNDTLSGIGTASGINWQGLYCANEKVIGSDPNDIKIGQVLKVGSAVCSIPVPKVTVTLSHNGSSSPVNPVANSQVNPGSYGGFQACVISRESGGNSQVMNSSGHYGLYQFSASTWADNGGNPADFGHASVAEQNAVFATAMSKPGGAENWSPYDGC